MFISTIAKIFRYNILILSVLSANFIRTDDFFDRFEEVPSSTPQTLGPIEKCGEGIQRGKFKCVPYYNCDPFNNTFVTYPEVDGSNNINPKFEYEYVTGRQCENLLEVCCQISDFVVTSLEHVPYIDLEFNPKCGLRDVNDITGEFPWMAALFNSSETSRPFCGGSLLTPVVVLTAAHCVDKFRSYEIKVRVGEWDLQTTNEKIPHQEKNVSEIIIHEHYLNSTLYNDVALLILNSSLSKADNVGTVCVSRNVEEINTKECLVSGWGKTSLNADHYSNKLKKIHTSLVANKTCKETLRESIGKEFILQESFICAVGDFGNDACEGDGGGPLVCPDSSQRYFQVGIVSWGLNCGEFETPGVYTNVSQFGDWIDFKLAILGYKSDPYTPNMIINDDLITFNEDTY